jgi:hypothetical protein
MKKYGLSLLLLAGAAANAGDPGMLGFRLGMRANSTDFALFGGPSLHAAGLVVSEDFWINPYRRTELAPLGEHHWAQYQMLRYGFTTGLRYNLGTEQLSVLPGVGIENLMGSYYGTNASPDWRLEEWAGLEVGFLKYHRIGVRWTTGEQMDHSRLRIEWTVQWR